MLKFGIIGCGGIAAGGHAPWFRFLPGAGLEAVCDLDPDRARNFARRFGVERFYSTPSEMLDQAGLDAVAVCTPSWVHAEPAVEALNRGISVLCEKPMALNVGDCDRMVLAAENTQAELMVGLHKRYNPGYQRAMELIRSGAIGDIISVRYEFTGVLPNGNNPRVRALARALGRMGLDTSAFTNRWADQPGREGFGVFSELGSHGVDFLLWCLGPAESVSAGGLSVMPELNFEDNAVAMLRFKSGATATVEVSYSRVTFEEREFAEFHGTRGNLALRAGTAANMLPARVLVQKTGLSGAWRDMTPIGLHAPPNLRKYQFFLPRVRGNPKPSDPGADGIQGRETVKVVSAFYKSLASGRQTIVE